MKTLRFLLAVSVLVLLLNSCKTNEETRPALPLIANGDMEQQAPLTPSTQNWYFGYYYNLTSNPNGYVAQYTTETAASGMRSLKINCDAIKNDTTYCFYEQNVSPNTIATGSKLTLKAKIKTTNLQGRGVALAMIGYKQVGNTNTIVFFPSTEKTPITGTSDFKEYTVTLDSYPGSIDVIAVHLFYLPKTTGIAYLDDVSLTVN